MIYGLSDNLLPVARQQIKKAHEDLREKGKRSDYYGFFSKNSEENKIEIIEVYENYTAAFGMIVNQSGFQSAFAMYNDNKSNSDGERYLITKLLFKILKTQDDIMITEDEYNKCKDAILGGEHNTDNYEDLFKEASIALKRSIRTFDIVKK